MLSGRRIETAFDLLGRKENDVTFSMGWALAASPRFLSRFLREVFASEVGAPVGISLQASGADHGYTDIEVSTENAHLIVEAKRGWVLPTEKQLSRYAGRFTAGLQGRLLAVTECSPVYASLHLSKSVRDVKVQHRSWQQVKTDVANALAGGGTHEKRLLRDFRRYLRGVMTMQDVTSNWTYVVSVGGTPAGWDISFRDVILKYGKYFHAYGRGGGWPKTPPTYIAFRWDGRLRQIHHVDTYEIVEDLHPLFPEIPSTGHTDIVYTLGPPMVPDHVVVNGANYRASRFWVALDLLLTCSTIKEAHERTKLRQHGTLAEPA